VVSVLLITFFVLATCICGSVIERETILGEMNMKEKLTRCNVPINEMSGYQTQGTANANIFCFIIMYLNTDRLVIDRTGDVSCKLISMLLSIMLGGVSGDAEDTGNVKSEQHEGVVGVVGVYN
jgi:hypothetical protein